MNAPKKNNITAVIMAGGRGKRLAGQDKGLLRLHGKPYVELIIDAIKMQAAEIIINANRNQNIYADYGYPVISDELTDYQGPLAGIAAALAACNTEYIITLPCDGPALPVDLVNRLIQALNSQDADLAIAHDGKRMQQMYALIPCTLLDSLRTYLGAGDRKVDLWYEQQNRVLADFSDVAETFLNINTEDDHLDAIKRSP